MEGERARTLGMCCVYAQGPPGTARAQHEPLLCFYIPWGYRVRSHRAAEISITNPIKESAKVSLARQKARGAHVTSGRKAQRSTAQYSAAQHSWINEGDT